ncbi:alpha-L-rhamnosidase [Pelagicoccus sp. NFK12]|uniref:Alpha-L-rhamnosidase n=1 Tax=Pelagicoccus enzymogenes TaxID=2773457 RepID=A0A927F8R7_9BACT|nr:glycosyl hydrolase [Pelagicoccus enzymogenes]MBD5780414.1 alpha-L-rhamnosidase [Pelagicoccus enzymogenes]
MPHLSRRRFLELSSITGLGLLLAPIACTRSPKAATASVFAKAFANPPRPYQPKFRWWWPHGLVDPQQIRREINAMADAGFGGAEIADVHHSARGVDLHADTHGWGTAPWRDAVQAALEQAKERGMSIDHSIGPSWPAASNQITPDSDAACKELATATTVLDAGEAFDGPVPPPASQPHKGVEKQTLQYVQAIRTVDGTDLKAKEVAVHGDSLIDLSSQVSNDHLQWTAPSEGTWILISYWLRGSGQQPEGGPHTSPESYVVDHFSQKGTDAVIALWKKSVLTAPIKKLMREVGGNLFEDSIEMETKETVWTPRILEEFEERRGYSALPYLPIIVEKKEDPIFEYVDFDARHIWHDWWQTLSELFLENHFTALKQWANSLGLGFRGQPYGLKTDAVRAAATLDIAEGESLGFKNLDDYRSLAGGRDMGGRKILSNEAGAFQGLAYSTTWKRVLKKLNPQFAAGVNQTVLHGFSYAEAPGANWPGFSAFTPYGGGPGYSESWGPRQPSWEHITDISGYFSRVHYLLQQGQPQIDIAFLRQKGYAGSGFGAPWFSKEGVSVGWTHEFISPSTLELPTATVRNGLLAPDGPAFQALVFEGDAFHGRKCTFELPAARRLLELAEAGLPILAIGDWTQPTSSGRPNPADDATLREIFARILEQDNVVMVPSRGYIEQGLENLGIKPRISHSKANIVHAERRTADGRWFYFCNQSSEGSSAATVQVPLADGPNHPHHLDLWTGEITQMQNLEAIDGKLQIKLPLEPNGSLAFCITNTPLTHKERDTNPVDNSTIINSLPLRNWKLSVESWLPGDSPSSTRKEVASIPLEHPQPWSEIETFANDSGIGTYECTFDASEEMANSPRAGLMWEEAFDTLRISLNGKTLPPCNLLRNTTQLKGFLVEGTNTLRIETSSTLINRLRVSDPKVYQIARRQAYGVSGPVQLLW